MKISAYKLKTFLSCPLKYYYQYEQGLGNIYKEQNEQLLTSVIIHKSLFQIIEQEKEDKVEEIVLSIAKEYDVKDMNFINKLQNALKNYIQKTTVYGKVYRNNDYIKTFWNGNEYSVVIDRIDIEEDKESSFLTIIDYKTGNYLPSEVELKNDIQLNLYTYLVEKKFNIPVIRIVYSNVMLLKDVVIERNNFMSLNELNRAIKDFVSKINAYKKTEFPATPGSQCLYCNFRIICPYVDENVRNIKKNTPILGDLYNFIEITKELSAILDEEKLINSIENNLKIMANTADVKLIKSEQNLEENSSIKILEWENNNYYIQYKNKPQLSLKKETLLTLFYKQIEIFLKNAILYNQANRDMMTGLFHHYYIKNYVNSLIKNHISFSLIMFDIDHFKKINDLYGHQIGDIALKEFVSIMNQNVRLDANDIIGRYGGEEFVVILVNKDKKLAYKIAERVRKAIKKNKILLNNEKILQYTISGGINAFPEGGEDSYEVFENCDKALYEAKNNGRNKIIIYN